MRKIRQNIFFLMCDNKQKFFITFPAFFQFRLPQKFARQSDSGSREWSPAAILGSNFRGRALHPFD
jgi:hypothetical protein